MSHKKKAFDTLSKERYSRETLHNLVREILNGRMTVHKAHKDSDIPVRSIQHHVKCVAFFVLFGAFVRPMF